MRIITLINEIKCLFLIKINYNITKKGFIIKFMEILR
jgi:hypothetical protein